MRKASRKHVSLVVVAALAGALSFMAAGCGGGGGSKSASTEVKGLGTSISDIKAKARDEGKVNLVIWAGTPTSPGPSSSPRRQAAR